MIPPPTPKALTLDRDRMSITQVSNFDVKKLSVSPVRPLDNGAKLAYINYDGAKLILQAPCMVTPYGFDKNDRNARVKYAVNFSLRDYETNPKMKAFYQAIQQIDDFMIDHGVKNSKAWFKKDQSREMVSEFYTPILHFSRHKETGELLPYPPTVKLSLPNRNGTFTTKMFDDKLRLYEGVPMEELVVRNMQAIATIEFAFVWVADKKFGVTMNAHQMVITKLPESLGNACGIVVERDGEEEETEEAAPAPAPAPIAPKRAPVAPAVPSVLAAMVDDDEALGSTTTTTAAAAAAPAAEEEAPPVDEEPAPIPKKTVAIKKKVVIAKK